MWSCFACRLPDVSGPGPGGVSANIGAEGIRGLADSPAAGKLRRLDICWNAIDQTAVDALVGSPHLGDLEELRVAEDGLTEATVRRLKERFARRVRFPFHPAW